MGYVSQYLLRWREAAAEHRGCHGKRPRLLLLDEPTASLDNSSKQKVRDLIEQLKNEGTTMLGIFHDLEFMEGLCDREYNMQKGMLA